jgi:hypothetical protein
MTNVPLFLKRFTLSYFKEGACIEYFINDRSTRETISFALIFSCDPVTRNLHVSRFYPEIYLQPDSQYLSAACFYLLIHHCAAVYALDAACRITLETVPTISSSFYRRLKDFNFRESSRGLGNVVYLTSDINRLPIDTSMIRQQLFYGDELPFLK